MKLKTALYTSLAGISILAGAQYSKKVDFPKLLYGVTTAPVVLASSTLRRYKHAQAEPVSSGPVKTETKRPHLYIVKGVGLGEFEPELQYEEKPRPEIDHISQFLSEDDPTYIKSRNLGDTGTKLRMTYELEDINEINSIYNMPGMSLGRMARDAKISRNDLLDTLACTKKTYTSNMRWNRELATRAGDMGKIYSIVSDWTSASDVARRIQEQTGFVISKSTLYRMRRDPQ